MINSTIYSYFAIGLAIGFLLGIFIVYLFPYRKLKAINADNQKQVEQLQIDLSGLNNKLLKDQVQHQQDRQLFSQKQQQLEKDLEEAQGEKIKLEGQHADHVAQANRERQMRTQESQQLRHQLERLQTEKETLQNKLIQESVRIQELQREKDQLAAWFEHLEGEKTQLEERLEKERNEWQEIQLEADMKIAQGQTEKKHLEDKLASSMGNDFNIWEQELATLRDRLDQAGLDKKKMEEKMSEQKNHAERERQALEEEIEQLLDRMIRLQEMKGDAISNPVWGAAQSTR